MKRRRLPFESKASESKGFNSEGMHVCRKGFFNTKQRRRAAASLHAKKGTGPAKVLLHVWTAVLPQTSPEQIEQQTFPLQLVTGTLKVTQQLLGFVGIVLNRAMTKESS